jgi:hypothetical protein
MTARCDLEHGKYTVINYLPIVPFSDWVERAFHPIFSKRLLAKISNDIRGRLEKLNIQSTLLEIYPMDQVIRRESKGAEQKALLEKAADLKTLKESIGIQRLTPDQLKALVKISPKEAEKIVEELIGQRLPEYYFLDSIDVSQSSKTSHVALLRNMTTIDRSIMNSIVAGIDPKDVEPDTAKILDLTQDTICTVVGVLRSPDVEHLAQVFSQLFVRIGLEDHGIEMYEAHKAWLVVK